MTLSLPAGADVTFSQQPLLSRVNAPIATDDPTAARAVAEEFEAVFVAQMLNHMFAGIETDGPFGGGQSEKLYRSMLNQQYAKHLSEAGGIGIADAIYTELIKAQESLTS